MNNVSAILIEQLEKTYKKAWGRSKTIALRGVSLDVKAGEAFGFIGPNGAGKSTTIKILMGLMSASSGRASIFGVSVNEPAARVGLGYVPENPYLYSYLTPLEILEMGLHLHRVAADDYRKHSLNWLERLGLAEVATKQLRSFSKGMVQRVAIAQALAIMPRLLVLDEPLSGLDPLGRRDVVGILSDYKRSGGTLFFTSHVLFDVERLADRFGLIHKGELRAVRSPAELVGGDELLLVRSLGNSPVAGMNQEFPGRWAGQIGRGALWQVLSNLERAGHALLEVRPALSLEAAFMSAVSEA